VFDDRFSTGAPFLDPVAGAAGLLGIGLCFFNVRKKLTWVLVPGLFLGLSANALSIQCSPSQVNYVQAVRLSVVIPFLYLAVGQGLEWVFGFLKAVGSGKSYFLGVCLSAALALSLWLNGPVLWHDYSQNPGAQGTRGFNMIRTAQFFNTRFTQDHLMGESTIITPVVYFLTRDQAKFKIFNNDPELPIKYKARRNVLLIFEPWRISDKGIAKIKATYPNAIWAVLKDPWNQTYANTVEIQLKDIQGAQRGLDLGEDLP
jgi:hypothetical protein